MGRSTSGWARVAGTSVRARVLRAIIAMALAPLVLLGALTLVNLQRLSARSEERISRSRDVLRQQVLANLASEARDVAADVSRFIAERVKDVELWAADPVVVRGAEGGSAEAVRLGLPSRSTADLEGRFADTRTIGNDAEATRYLLVQQNGSPAFAELLFTDMHGYAVASTVRPADFVQSDEPWWTGAMAKGLDVGPVAYDESNSSFSTEIAVRVQNADREPVGVIRAVLAMNRIHNIVNQYANEGGVSIVDERGRLIAETASRHDATRILNDSIDVVGDLPVPLAEAFRSARRTPRAAVAEDIALGAAGTRSVKESSDLVPFDWVVTISQPAGQAFRPLQSVDELGTDISRSTRWVAGVVLLLLVIVALAAVFVGRTLADRITQPILALRDAARRTASIDLPELVAAIDRAQPGDKLPHIAPVAVGPGDEVESLAESYNALITTASDLAAEQVDSRRRNVATAFVSMGRRNQKLVSRQLQGFDDLERSETDPDRLASIFQLDHLATRMRRNAESLLVLAGEEPVRRWTAPVHLRDVVRAAVTEIEDLDRVEIDTIHDGAVKGQYVADIAHLLAELLENAAMFSPPDVSVTVQGRVRGDRYVISVIDQGMGMTADEIYDANQRLAHPEEFDRAPSQMLGLFVVGRLAARHGIEARLFETSTGGMTARVTLPAEILELPVGATPFHPQGTQVAAAAAEVGAGGDGPAMTARPYTVAESPRKWGPDDAFRPPSEEGADDDKREGAAGAARPAGVTGPVDRTPPAPIAPPAPLAPIAPPPPGPVGPAIGIGDGESAPAAGPAPAAGAGPAPEVTPSGFRRRSRTTAAPVNEAGPEASGTPVAAPVPEPAAGDSGDGPSAADPQRDEDAGADGDDDRGRADVTMSGFHRRPRVEPGDAPVVANGPGVAPRPEPAPRSADEVRTTLSSFVSGVDRGRRDAAAPVPTGPAGPSAAPDAEAEADAAPAGAPGRLVGEVTPSGLRRRARTSSVEAAATGAAGGAAPAQPADGAPRPRSADDVRTTLTAFVGGVDRGRRDAAGDPAPEPAGSPDPAADPRSADDVRSTLTAFVAGVDRGRREVAGEGSPDAPSSPEAGTHPDDAMVVTGASNGTASSEEGQG